MKRLERSRYPLLAALIAALAGAAAPAPARAARPDLPTLSDAQQEKIRAGQFCLLSARDEDDETARIQGVLEIDATDAEIWEIILDPASVQDSAKAMKEVELLRDETLASGQRQLDLSFFLKVGPTEIRYHARRDYYPDQNHMTFEMDTSKDNDIDWTEGSYTTFEGLTEGRRLLLYSLVIDTGRNVPKWLEEDLTESSLKRYLLYVKKKAEG